MDERHQPISFATVSLLRSADSSQLKSVPATENGIFIFDAPEGSYLVSISITGFDKVTKGPFVLSPEKPVYQLGDIQLFPATKQLAGVTITYRKPLIERQADKTVLNIENSILAAGNTALEVLEKAPGVTVGQGGVISLRGKPGVTIMLDGKMNYLSGDDLTSLLTATQGTEIQSIELITNPSSGFDASGTGGIINIRTKRNKVIGTNGTATLAGGYGKYAKENGNLILNHREGKITTFAGASFNHGKSWLDNNITRTNITSGTNTYFDQTGRTIRIRDNYSYKAGLDYNIDSKSIIGFAVNGSNGKSDEPGNVLTLIGSRPFKTDSLVKAANSTLAKNHNMTYDLNYRSNLDTLGRELSFDATYSRYVRNRGDEYDNSYLISPGIPAYRTEPLPKN